MQNNVGQRSQQWIYAVSEVNTSMAKCETAFGSSSNLYFFQSFFQKILKYNSYLLQKTENIVAAQKCVLRIFTESDAKRILNCSAESGKFSLLTINHSGSSCMCPHQHHFVINFVITKIQILLFFVSEETTNRTQLSKFLVRLFLQSCFSPQLTPYRPGCAPLPQSRYDLKHSSFLPGDSPQSYVNKFCNIVSFDQEYILIGEGSLPGRREIR